MNKGPLIQRSTSLRCRQRVRRSDIEDILARTGFLDGRLNDPQAEGGWCSCPPNTQPNEENMRTSLERIFIGRASELVNHPSSLAKQLRRKLHPDRVYGLRETRHVGEILQTALSGNSPVQDLVARQPHSSDGKPLLFPFLVVEAKGSKASDDWHSICLQTAFPIYTFLNAQQSLRAKAGHQLSRPTSDPLVWFIMSRGEDWRVYLAYQGPTRGVSGATRRATKVVRVWVGCITNLDSALQLLLIVEYLSD
ncbi:hypothetical protein BJX66DRAFT_291345 [Aspergillus keveii]|uniref:Uncharacterized protein n=1 Tax=Aspergillus keveii TaxID=714993 RepID=A0ABR4GM40_9EURO